VPGPECESANERGNMPSLFEMLTPRSSRRVCPRPSDIRVIQSQVVSDVNDSLVASSMLPLLIKLISCGCNAFDLKPMATAQPSIYSGIIFVENSQTVGFHSFEYHFHDAPAEARAPVYYMSLFMLFSTATMKSKRLFLSS
jgi:hypothetical protein